MKFYMTTIALEYMRRSPPAVQQQVANMAVLEEQRLPDENKHVLFSLAELKEAAKRFAVGQVFSDTGGYTCEDILGGEADIDRLEPWLQYQHDSHSARIEVIEQLYDNFLGHLGITP